MSWIIVRMHMHPSVTQVIFWPALWTFLHSNLQTDQGFVFQCILILTVAISAWSAVRIVLHMSDAGHVAVCKFPYMYMWYTHLYLTQAIEPNLVWDHFPLHAATTCIAWLLFKPEWMNLPTTISCSWCVHETHCWMLLVKGNLYNCDNVNASEITICHVKTDPVHVWWSYGCVEIFHICTQSVRKSCSEQS